MVKVNVIGFKELDAKIKSASSEMRKKIAFVIQNGGESFKGLAKKSLASGILKNPTGQLEGSITKIPEGHSNELHCEVVAGKEYAPYVEWGTITKVQVPSELADYAAQFKGKGLRKNGGMSPRPFFFKHIPTVKKEIENDINDVLQNLI